MTSSRKQLSKARLQEFCEVAAATGLLDLNKAMIEAARKGQTEIVEALLDGGADVHASVSKGTDGTLFFPEDEAICRASEGGQAETVRVLLAHGANVHAMDRGAHKDFPLRLAAASGDVHTVQALLQAGANVHASSTGGIRDRALLRAAWSGYADIVDVLLQAGADNYSCALEEAQSPAQGGPHDKTIALLTQARKNTLGF